MKSAQFVVGLTGGIASGKSSVANAFTEHGVQAVDLDDTAREVVQPGSTLLAQIKARFGKEAINAQGELNRRRMRELIFNDAHKKQWLESLLHPAIIEAAFNKLGYLTGPYVLLVAPLLMETRLHQKVDRVLVVDTTETNQILRCCERDQLDPDEAKLIITQQIKRSERLRLAHDVIENNKDLRYLQQQIRNLHQNYLKLARHKQTCQAQP